LVLLMIFGHVQTRFDNGFDRTDAGDTFFVQFVARTHEEGVTCICTLSNSQHDTACVVKQFFARRKFSAGSNECLPLHLVGVTFLQQQNFHCPTSSSFKFQPRRQHPRVINNENISCA